MAQTSKNNIYYNDNYDDKADVLADMKKLAESVDTAVENAKYNDSNITARVSTLETDNTTNKKDISDLKGENETQDTNIEELQENLSDAQQEIEALKTIQNALPVVNGEGENITLKGTAENTTFKKFKICGNSRQETRNGYNKFNAKLFSNQTQAGATQTIQEDGTISITGTGKTTDNYNGSASNTRVPLSLKVGNLHIKIDKQSRPAIYLALRNSDDELIGNTVTNFQGSVDTTINITQELIDAGIFLHQYIYTEKDITIIPNDVKVMLYQDGDGTYEAYGAMPSPDYPSKVETVGDDINLYPGWEKGSVNSTTGQLENTTSSYIRGIDFIPVIPNKNYTIKAHNIVGFHSINTAARMYDSNKNYLGNQGIGEIKKDSITFELTNSNVKYIKLVHYNGEILADTIQVDIKLQEGETATKWSPYGTGSASTTISNKNLCNNGENYENWTPTGTSDGTITYNSKGFKVTTEGQNSRIVNLRKLPHLENGKTYRLSYKVTELSSGESVQIRLTTSDGTEKYGTQVTQAGQTGRITIAGETGIKSLIIYGNLNVSGSFAIEDIQIEENTTSTDYVEHQEQNFTMPVQKEMLVGDYFDLDTLEEVHIWDKTVFDGNENLGSSVHDNEIEFAFLKGSFASRDLLSNYFKNTTTWQKINTIITGSLTSGYIYIQCSKDDFPDVSSFKTWLAQKYEEGKPLEIYSKPATSQRLPMTDEQKEVAKQIKNTLVSYKDTTHVYSEDKISPIFKCSAIADMTAMLDNLQAQILANEEV